MTKVLITGASGLVGSALGAGFLERGAEVLCLERPDPKDPSSGELKRSREKIAAYAAGAGRPLDTAAHERIHPLPYDLSTLSEARWEALLRDVDLVWHCAAHMNFELNQLEEAWAFNILATLDLYRLIQKSSAKHPRFFFASTCYTAGLTDGPHPETLHLAPKLHNPYVVTKWSAESMFRDLASQKSALPITIFREPFVVGHSQTGWYGGKRMVYYAFLDACHMTRAIGNDSISVRLREDVIHSYIPIDDLVANAVGLSLDAEDDPFSIVHCLGTYLSGVELAPPAEAVYGLKVSYGPPKTEADAALDQFSEVYRHYHSPEAPAKYILVEERLPRLLGSKFTRHGLDQETLTRLVGWYANFRPPRGIPPISGLRS